MSSRIRTLERDFWDHPRVCVLPVFTRCLLIYCMTRIADDEGRFKLYAPALAERFLSSSDEHTIADIEHALAQCEEGGLFRRYGDNGEYGWFPGWFEHQNIPAERRSESSLPLPPKHPGQVRSWAETDAVRQVMAKALGRNLQQIRSDDAVRWYLNNPSAESIETAKPVSEPDRETIADDSPKAKTETAKQRKNRKAIEEEELLGEFSDEERELVDDYIQCADEKFKAGTTVGGRVSRLKALIAVANEVDDAEAFSYGLHQANLHRVANPNYVKQAALSRKNG